MLSSSGFSTVSLSILTFVPCFFSRVDDLNFRIFISFRLATSQFQSLKKDKTTQSIPINIPEHFRPFRDDYSTSFNTELKLAFLESLQLLAIVSCSYLSLQLSHVFLGFAFANLVKSVIHHVPTNENKHALSPNQSGAKLTPTTRR